MFDQFAVNNLRTANSNSGLAGSVAHVRRSGRWHPWRSATGIASGLQDFFNAWQDVANNPASTPTRQVLVSQAQALANRFNDASTRLDNVASDSNGRIRRRPIRSTSIATSLATINGDIVQASRLVGGQPPNDLLDKRDA